MTQRSAESYLIRIETAAEGARSGSVTSVRTGEHAAFDGLAELARILERWTDGGSARVQEDQR